MLTAEIIAVGSEMLTPFRTDTNSLWLTDQLNSVGVEVRLKTVVGDDDARLEETIRDALKRSGVVVLTGGLGPTEDDITRKIAARPPARDEADVRLARARQALGAGGRGARRPARAEGRGPGRVGRGREDRPG